ncbi:MAG TPA: hypothetical protein VJ963_03140 [Bacteroidales bacterium]|nr:hypothetical protein [Bacteroidales bacterium]
MNKLKTGVAFLSVALTCSSVLYLSSCSSKPHEGLVIITQVSDRPEDINYIDGNSWRYVPQSRIAEFDPANPEGSLKVLTSGFYSAHSPEVSSDGKSLLFAGQKNESDHWEIYEMDLGSSDIRQITSLENNCTDPAYMPLGGIVFSGNIPDDSIKSGHSLFTGMLVGTDINRITFNPHTYFASTVLSDGRILSISRKVYPKSGKAKLMVMRPDGTKCELFYNGPTGTTIVSRPRETNDNKIVFIEAPETKDGAGKVVSVEYNNPYETRKVLTGDYDGSFQSVFPEPGGKFLVTYKNQGDNKYSVYEFDPATGKLGEKMINNNDYDILEAVDVKVHPRARKLPSEVHPDILTGLIVCQDAQLLDPVASAKNPGIKRTARFEVIGIDSAMGDFEPEPDGSFYLRVKADKPFRLISLDSNGNVIQSCDWLWLRPNERRGCVGCHENPELAPANRIPLAVKKEPIGIPRHVSKIEEIFIDTE